MIRFNVYDGDKLIGQNYQRENGEWMSKWKSNRHDGFDTFSWRGKLHGQEVNNWKEIEASE